jgi:hypothetical protein
MILIIDSVGEPIVSKIDMHQQQSLLVMELLLLPYAKMDLSIIISRNFLELTMLGCVIMSLLTLHENMD